MCTSKRSKISAPNLSIPSQGEHGLVSQKPTPPHAHRADPKLFHMQSGKLHAETEVLYRWGGHLALLNQPILQLEYLERPKERCKKCSLQPPPLWPAKKKNKSIPAKTRTVAQWLVVFDILDELRLTVRDFWTTFWTHIHQHSEHSLEKVFND